MSKEIITIVGLSQFLDENENACKRYAPYVGGQQFMLMPNPEDPYDKFNVAVIDPDRFNLHDGQVGVVAMSMSEKVTGWLAGKTRMVTGVEGWTNSFSVEIELDEDYEQPSMFDEVDQIADQTSGGVLGTGGKLGKLGREVLIEVTLCKIREAVRKVESYDRQLTECNKCWPDFVKLSEVIGKSLCYSEVLLADRLKTLFPKVYSVNEEWAYLNICDAVKKLRKTEGQREVYKAELEAYTHLAKQKNGLIARYMEQQLEAPHGYLDVDKERLAQCISEVKTWLYTAIEGRLKGILGQPTKIAKQLTFARLNRRDLKRIYAHLIVYNYLNDLQKKLNEHSGSEKEALWKLMRSYTLHLASCTCKKMDIASINQLMQRMLFLNNPQLIGEAEQEGCRLLWEQLSHYRSGSMLGDKLSRVPYIKLIGELLHRGYLEGDASHIAKELLGSAANDNTRKLIACGFHQPDKKGETPEQEAERMAILHLIEVYFA